MFSVVASSTSLLGWIGIYIGKFPCAFSAGSCLQTNLGNLSHEQYLLTSQS